MNGLWGYLGNATRKLSIADKIYAIIVALVVLTALLLVMAVQSLRLQTTYRDELATSATAALNIERVNGLIYAIVMESRGIYFADDPRMMKYFTGELLRRNHELAHAMTSWEKKIRPEDIEQFASFKKRIVQFIEFRHELVRRATEISVAAGREWGANEANRTLRSALNEDLEAFAKIYTERANRVAELADRTRLASWFLAALGIGALLVGALNLLMLRRLVLMPLAEITAATDSISAGHLDVSIPFVGRSDEVGRLARAVQNSKDAIVERIKAEEREATTAKQRDAAIGQRDNMDDRYNAAKWQLSAAINNMPQGVVMLDSHGTVQVVNDRYRKIYGLPPEIKAGCSLRDAVECRVKSGLFTGDPEEYLAAILGRIAKRTPKVSEVELSDGRTIRIVEQAMDGGGWIATHDDCTEQYRVQRMLERTERFLVTVIESVPEAIAAKDSRSLRYVFVNRAAETLFNRPRAEIMGKTARELFSADIADMIEQGDRRLLEGDQPTEVAVHNVETPEGRRVHAVRRVPIKGPDGESRVFLSMIEDRTDWARAAQGQTLAA